MHFYECLDSLLGRAAYCRSRGEYQWTSGAVFLRGGYFSVNIVRTVFLLIFGPFSVLITIVGKCELKTYSGRLIYIEVVLILFFLSNVKENMVKLLELLLLPLEIMTVFYADYAMRTLLSSPRAHNPRHTQFY